MAPRDAIKLPQMALCLAPEILYSVYVVHPVSETLAVIYTVMFEFRKIQYLIALISIRIDDAVWPDLTFSWMMGINVWLLLSGIITT